MADISDLNSICARIYGLQKYLLQILWTKILFVADIMGLRYHLWRIFWTMKLFVADFMDELGYFFVADIMDILLFVADLDPR